MLTYNAYDIEHMFPEAILKDEKGYLMADIRC